MKHLDNIVLIILLRLLLNDEPLELAAKDRSMNSRNELFYHANAINSCINAQKNCLNVNIQNFTITLSIADRELLNTYLRGYADELNRGFYTDIDSISALKEELIATRNKNKTPSNYPIHDIRFMPCILSEYFQNETFISRVNIQTESTDNVAYPIKIYDYYEDGEPTGDFYDKYENYFDWEVCVNLEDYIKPEATTKKTQNLKTIKDKKFSKDEKRLFNFLINSANSGIFVVTKTELLPYCNKSSFDVIKNRLNKKYNKMYEKDIKLLSYSRTDAQYVISRDILN